MNGNYNNGMPNGYNYVPNNASLSLNDEVAKGMITYFNAKRNFNLLTEENKVDVTKAEYYMGMCKGPVKQIIDAETNKYYARVRAEGQLDNVSNVAELKQKNQTRALTLKEEAPMSRRAAFINIAILIYGSLNIGFIIALALLK